MPLFECLHAEQLERVHSTAVSLGQLSASKTGIADSTSDLYLHPFCVETTKSDVQCWDANQNCWEKKVKPLMARLYSSGLDNFKRFSETGRIFGSGTNHQRVMDFFDASPASSQG